MIIGLDISTSVVGIAVLKESGEISEIHHVDLRKIESNRYCEMADKVQLKLLEIKSNYPDSNFKVFVEEAGKKFRSGTSSASTIFSLARFNGIVCYTCWKTFETTPVEIDVKDARKSIGLTIPKFPRGMKYSDKKKEIKKAVIDFLLEDCKYSPEEMGFEKTKNDNWQVWCQDRADAIVIAKSGIGNKTSKEVDS